MRNIILIFSSTFHNVYTIYISNIRIYIYIFYFKYFFKSMHLQWGYCSTSAFSISIFLFCFININNIVPFIWFWKISIQNFWKILWKRRSFFKIYIFFFLWFMNINFFWAIIFDFHLTNMNIVHFDIEHQIFSYLKYFNKCFEAYNLEWFFFRENIFSDIYLDPRWQYF